MKKMLLFSFFVLFMSCEKEIPEGSHVIWYNKTVAESLFYSNKDNIEVYVNGKLSFSENTENYWTTEPECNQTGSMTINGKPGTYDIIIKVDGQTYWDFMVNIESDECGSTKIVI